MHPLEEQVTLRSSAICLYPEEVPRSRALTFQSLSCCSFNLEFPKPQFACRLNTPNEKWCLSLSVPAVPCCRWKLLQAWRHFWIDTHLKNFVFKNEPKIFLTYWSIEYNLTHTYISSPKLGLRLSYTQKKTLSFCCFIIFIILWFYNVSNITKLCSSHTLSF